MKNFLTVLTFTMISTMANAHSKILVAKCAFDYAIVPGAPFIYILKDSSGKFSVINSIATHFERIIEPYQGLSGEIEPVQAKYNENGNRSITWTQNDLTNLGNSQDNWILLEPTSPIYEMYETSGVTSFTKHVHPSCVRFGDL